MKVVILSDIHDNLPNLAKALTWCTRNGVKKIICCGDTANTETIKFLSENFSGITYLVRGNMDTFEETELQQFFNIKVYDEIGIVDFNNKKVGFCHQPYLIDKIFKKEKVDMIFYGHTHKPWQEERDGVKIVNPGTVAGMFYAPTFAFWDIKTDELELKLINRL